MATFDLHGNLDGLDPRGADVVVLAGDVSRFDERYEIAYEPTWVEV